jgi:hypothetical protein
VFHDAKDKAGAAKQWFYRNPTLRAELQGWGESVTRTPQSVTNSLKGSSIQGVRYGFPVPCYGFARYRYKRAGAGKSAIVYVRTDILNPLAHVEAFVGPCALWRSVDLSGAELPNDAPPAPTPLSLMAAQGIVFHDWTGIGQACAEMFRNAKDKAGAAKQWFYRNPTLRAELREFAESATPEFACYHYKLGDKALHRL